LVAFYRNFAKDFALIAAPLTAAQGAKPLVWTEDCQKAWITLRNIASEEPYLRSPVGQGHDNYVPLGVTADASNIAIGAVLSQQAGSGGSMGIGVLVDHPCGYLSELLSVTQRNYSTFDRSTFDRELLAIMFALQKWRQLLVAAIFTIITDHLLLVDIMKAKFLTGRIARQVVELMNFNFTIVHLLVAAIFTIITDHLLLVDIMKAKFLTGRIARQVVELMNFNFTIVHRPGAENTNADALSRLSFMPEEAPLVIAMILGHEVEFTENYFGHTGGTQEPVEQLVNLWLIALSGVDPATLPENRPEQTLRCTNNSVLMATRQHLEIQDQGEPGQQLGKTARSGSASQLAWQNLAEGKGGARTALNTHSLTPTTSNSEAGKTRTGVGMGLAGDGVGLGALPLTSTVGENDVAITWAGAASRALRTRPLTLPLGRTM
jgi:RNase H-like domain found in reverse transcriptase